MTDIRDLDLSAFDVISIMTPRGLLKANTPLSLEVVSDDSKQLLCVEDQRLNILAFGATREALLDELNVQLAMLWEEYTLADDEVIDGQAIGKKSPSCSVHRGSEWPRKQDDVEKSLVVKGFFEAQVDHNFFHYYSLAGKKTRVFTKNSHGAREIVDSVLSMMAKQCKLTNKEFRRLIDCPLDGASYEKSLIEQGMVDAANASKPG